MQKENYSQEQLKVLEKIKNLSPEAKAWLYHACACCEDNEGYLKVPAPIEECSNAGLIEISKSGWLTLQDNVMNFAYFQQHAREETSTKPVVKHSISEDGKTLTLSVDKEDQMKLLILRDNDEKLQDTYSSSTVWGTDACEAEVLEDLLCNSELQWLNAEDVGALTSAPLLGVIGSDEETSRTNEEPFGTITVGKDEKGTIYSPIIQCWGYEPYQIRTFLDDLADKGKAVFTQSW